MQLRNSGSVHMAHKTMFWQHTRKPQVHELSPHSFQLLHEFLQFLPSSFNDKDFCYIENGKLLLSFAFVIRTEDYVFSENGLEDKHKP